MQHGDNEIAIVVVSCALNKSSDKKKGANENIPPLSLCHSLSELHALLTRSRVTSSSSEEKGESGKCCSAVNQYEQ